MSEQARSRPAWVTAAFLLVAALLVGAHSHVARLGPSYAGPLLIVDHVFDLGATGVLLLVCTAVGQRTLYHLRIEFGRPLEELLFSLACGMGLTATAILALGMVGFLYPLALGTLFLVLAWAARHGVAAIPRLLRETVIFSRERGGGPALLALVALASILVALVLIILAVAPPSDWDALMYHLRVPGQWLDAHRIFLLEDNLHVSRVGLVHMLYVPLLAAGSASGPALLSAALAASLSLGIFSLCERYLGGATAGFCALVFWGTGTVLLVAVTPRVDLTLTLYLFLAHYALLLILSTTGAQNGRTDGLQTARVPTSLWTSRYLLAAAFLGFGFGIKYHALVYGAALSPLIVWCAVTRGATKAQAARALAAFAVVVAAISLPWLVKNWVLLRAPLYPFLASPVVQPWLVPFLGGAEFPPGVDPALLQTAWLARNTFNLGDFILAPHKLTIEGEALFYFVTPVLLLLPLWIFSRRRRVLSWLLGPALGYVLFVLLYSPRTNLRYLLPGQVVLTVVAASAAYSGLRWLARDKAAGVFAMTLMVLPMALLPSAATAYFVFNRTRALEYFIGSASQADYRADNLQTGSGYPAMVTFVNTRLPSEARVLLLAEARGYYFHDGVVQDNKTTNWSLLARAGGDIGCLEKGGFTHVLLNGYTIEYKVRGGVNPDLFELGAFEEFADRCLKELYRRGEYVLYGIRRPGKRSIRAASGN